MGVVSRSRIRLAGYRRQIVAELREAFSADHSPREIARSFSIGVFITMLPTLGAGLIVFVILSSLFRWINKVALFASVLVFNPVVKWGVYAGSISLGVLLLGPVEGMETASFSRDTGWDVLLRLWVGNLILAVIAAVAGYVVVYRMVVAYRDRETHLVGDVLESVYQEFPQFEKLETESAESADSSTSDDPAVPTESAESATRRTDDAPKDS